MAIAAQTAVREWINGRTTDLVGPGNPLPNGAYLLPQAVPETGAYTVVSRTSEGVTSVVAEDPSATSLARMQCLVFAGTIEASELAAAALRTAFESLRGNPEPCGNTGVWVLVTDNHIGPILIQWAPTHGEVYAHQVNADFVLAEF
jgi:hypothetical protein